MLLRGTRLPALQAAVLNASLGHALDFDDTLDTGGSIHPGVSVLASVLATADRFGGVSGGMCCWRWLWGSTYRAASLLVATALVHGKVGIAEVDGLGDAAVLALADRTAGWRAIAGRGGL